MATSNSPASAAGASPESARRVSASTGPTGTRVPRIPQLSARHSKSSAAAAAARASSTQPRPTPKAPPPPAAPPRSQSPTHHQPKPPPQNPTQHEPPDPFRPPGGPTQPLADRHGCGIHERNPTHPARSSEHCSCGPVGAVRPQPARLPLPRIIRRLGTSTMTCRHFRYRPAAGVTSSTRGRRFRRASRALRYRCVHE